VIRSRIPDTSNGSPDFRDEVTEVAALIAERFQPDRIVLFGPRAPQRADAESDADLMVIMETATSPIKQAVAIVRTVPYRILLDVLVRTPEQIAIGLAEENFFILDVLTEGITLFEAGDASVDR
jgi:predicted nucleotidyltransferase